MGFLTQGSHEIERPRGILLVLDCREGCRGRRGRSNQSPQSSQCYCSGKSIGKYKTILVSIPATLSLMMKHYSSC